MRIGKLDESDFDEIVMRAGGRRFSVDSSREARENVDYVLGEAIVELKLVDEEGLEKEERRRTIAGIFRAQQPNRPVIILRPTSLDLSAQRAYYGAMAGPIKAHVKKANRQLKSSAMEMDNDPIRVALLVNNGYAALSHEEFKDIVITRACNDTHSIDAVVVGGLYYYSDGFDMYFFPRMDLFSINVKRPFASYDTLEEQWRSSCEELMTQFVSGDDARRDTRLPVQDLRYELEGITYVKPAPPMGRSNFYTHGRPRKDSTRVTSCPPVAETFPNLDPAEWQQFRDACSWDRLSSDDFFKSGYGEWMRYRQTQEEQLGTPTKPFVPVHVAIDKWLCWCEETNRRPSVPALCDYACEVFDKQVREIIEAARDLKSNPVMTPRYGLLITEEIGQDKANDLCSIYLVEATPQGGYRRDLVVNARMFFEHGLALASAYAMKAGVGAVRYEKDQANAWD